MAGDGFRGLPLVKMKSFFWKGHERRQGRQTGSQPQKGWSWDKVLEAGCRTSKVGDLFRCDPGNSE